MSKTFLFIYLHIIDKMVKTKNSKSKINKSRKIKKYGGDLGTNLTRAFTKDIEISKNFHESIIKVNGTNYVLQYIVPDHFFFKDPDQVFKTPEFEVILSGKKIPKCMFMLEDNSSIVSMFVKLQNAGDPTKYKWFVIIPGVDQVSKTGELLNYVFYSLTLKSKIGNVKGTNVLFLKEDGAYKIKESKNDKCTVLFKKGAVKIVNKNSIYQEILFNFYVQQQTQEGVKEIAATEGVFALGDILF